MNIPERKYQNDITYLFTFKGNLLVMTSTTDKEKGVLFDVYNKEGRYIDCFWLNVPGTLNSTHEDFFFVREQDEDGIIRIVK